MDGSNKVTWRHLIVIFSVVSILLLVSCGQQYRRVKLNGYSMEPNYTDGDIFKIIETPLSEFKRGDLVLVNINGTLLIKRLIGLPNETVSIHDGKVFINGIQLIEPYKVIPSTYTINDLNLGSDSYFVLGDNRPKSLDSHLAGPVKGSDIEGKAVP